MDKKEKLFRDQAEKKLKEEYAFNFAVEDILKVQNLGIDYASFETVVEFMSYFEGLMIPGFDEPMHIKRIQKTALRKLFSERKKKGLKY